LPSCLSDIDQGKFDAMTSLEPVRLAAIAYHRGFDIDRLLVEACERLARRGVRLGGLLQISTGGKGGCAATVHVVDLRTNTAFDIWEKRGPCARGCRLDEGGLATASRVIDDAIDDRVDLVVMNRFGRAESLGGGLLSSLSSAATVGVPVLTAVLPPYNVAWRNSMAASVDSCRRILKPPLLGLTAW
jgi:hypothetical protein